jgi:cytochrome c-type biogenesis protein
MVPLTGGASELVVSGPLLVALLIAAAAGAVSFFSPCCLPLVPGYLSYVAGISGAENQPTKKAGILPADEPRVAAATRGQTAQAATATFTAIPIRRRRSRIVAGAVLFVAGFAVVFTSYGLFFGALGAWLIEYQHVLVRILGAITIVLGLMFTGALSRIPLAGRTVRLGYQPRTGLVGAPLMGILFGLGWTPCIGPTLAAVLTLATTSADAGRGAALSFACSAGLGIPFIVAAMSIQKVMASFEWTSRHARAVMHAGGGMLILLGLLQVTGLWLYVMSWLQTFIVGWTVPL